MTVIVLLYLRGFLSKNLKNLVEVNTFDAVIEKIGSKIHPLIQSGYDRIDIKHRKEHRKEFCQSWGLNIPSPPKKGPPPKKPPQSKIRSKINDVIVNQKLKKKHGVGGN